jgi:hypothetical protein
MQRKECQRGSDHVFNNYNDFFQFSKYELYTVILTYLVRNSSTRELVQYLRSKVIYDGATNFGCLSIVKQQGTNRLAIRDLLEVL